MSSAAPALPLHSPGFDYGNHGGRAMTAHKSTYATMTSPLPKRYEDAGGSEERGGSGQAQGESDRSQANVGRSERQVSIAAGAIAAMAGLARRDRLGLLIAGIGGAMLYRGISGTCPAYRLA